MIKHSQNQTGSTHVVIIVILIVALVGVLGFVFWQNFIKKDAAEVKSVDTTSQTKPSEDPIDKEDVLAAGNFDGKTGTFQARGYLYTEDVPEPYCTSNCVTYKRAFFYISESPNQAIAVFISEHEGNSFVANSAIALGCVVDGKVQATGRPFGTPSGDKIYSTDVSTQLINSSKAKPVSVEIGRSAEPSGVDAPTCYSHFDSISIL